MIVEIEFDEVESEAGKNDCCWSRQFGGKSTAKNERMSECELCNQLIN